MFNDIDMDVTGDAEVSPSSYITHSNWYEFDHMKDIIVPFDLVERELLGKVARNRQRIKGEPTQTNQDSAPGVQFRRRELVPIVVGNGSKLPVIACLGHFNHGKSTLINALHRSSLSELDHRGCEHSTGAADIDHRTDLPHVVTQGLRCRIVPLALTGSDINAPVICTIVDTPGQEIFYRMRAYGAGVADCVLLVVSLTEGVCVWRCCTVLCCMRACIFICWLNM